MSEQRRYDAIDGIRTFSCIGILLMHILANGEYQLDGFVYYELIPSFAHLVFLFMIISGFSLSCGYYDKVIKQKISVNEFYNKRYAKIWPFFAFLCIVDLIISPSLDSLYEVIANLTLCFGLLPNPEMAVIGVGWFLGTIFVFYLIFPFFCYLISNKKRAWFAFSIALILNYLCEVYFDVGRSNFVYSAVFFLAGGLIYVYRDALAEMSKKYRWLLLIVCLVLIVVYYLLSKSTVMLLILYSFFLIYAIGIDTNGLLQNSITKFISGISLEIYLSHMVIYRALEKIGIAKILGVGLLSYILTCILVFMGAVCLALTFNYVNNKMQFLYKRRKRVRIKNGE